MEASYHKFEFRDIDQFMEYISLTADSLSIQLQPSPLRLKDELLEFDNFILYHSTTRQKMLDRFSIHPDHLVFNFPSNTDEGCKWCGMDVPSDSLAVLHPIREHIALIPDNFDLIGIMFKNEIVWQESLLSEYLWNQTLQPEKALFKHETPRILLFRSRLMDLFKSPERLIKNEQAILKLKNWILDELRTIFLEIEAVQNPHKLMVKKPNGRYRILTKTIDMIEENLVGQLSVKQICDQVGTTPRTLQQCFKELMGVSPLQYILARKLQAVQQQLFMMQDSRIPISHLAQDYGFHHLGRFSTQYKRMFDELPSSTIKRRQRLKKRAHFSMSVFT